MWIPLELSQMFWPSNLLKGWVCCLTDDSSDLWKTDPDSLSCIKVSLSSSKTSFLARKPCSGYSHCNWCIYATLSSCLYCFTISDICHPSIHFLQLIRVWITSPCSGRPFWPDRSEAPDRGDVLINNHTIWIGSFPCGREAFWAGSERLCGPHPFGISTVFICERILLVPHSCRLEQEYSSVNWQLHVYNHLWQTDPCHCWRWISLFVDLTLLPFLTWVRPLTYSISSIWCNNSSPTWSGKSSWEPQPQTWRC